LDLPWKDHRNEEMKGTQMLCCGLGIAPPSFFMKRQGGVKVGERYDNPGCGKYFDFYDPDGHMMKVCQDWKYFDK
jgi:hypothetical protein